MHGNHGRNAVHINIFSYPLNRSVAHLLLKRKCAACSGWEQAGSCFGSNCHSPHVGMSVAFCYGDGKLLC